MLLRQEIMLIPQFLMLNEISIKCYFTNDKNNRTCQQHSHNAIFHWNFQNYSPTCYHWLSVSENSEKCIVEYSLTCPIGNYTILEILAGDGKYTGTWTLILPFYPNQGILPSSAWGLPWVISIKFLLPTLICVKKSSPQFSTSFRGYENKTRQVLVGILYQ